MTADTELNSDDLHTVFMKFHCARDKWYEIGLELKMDATTLDEIELVKKNNSGRLREILRCRLQASSPLTWRDLCECLKSVTVDHKDAAEKMKKWLEGTYLPAWQVGRARVPSYSYSWFSLSACLHVCFNLSLFSSQFRCLLKLSFDSSCGISDQ